MASLAARSTSACATFPAEKGGDTEGTKKENDESIVDPDAALLMSMDREVHKYERLTRLNSKLEEEIKGGSPRRSTSSSSGGRPAGVPPNFAMSFLTAKTLSPATKMSMRSLVDSMSPLSRKVLLESLLEKDVDHSAKRTLRTASLSLSSSSSSSSSSLNNSRSGRNTSRNPPRSKHSSRKSDSKSESPGTRQRKKPTRDFSATYSSSAALASSFVNSSPSSDTGLANQPRNRNPSPVEKMSQDVAKLEAELAELLEAREVREGEDDDDSSLLVASFSGASEGLSGSDLSDISATGRYDGFDGRPVRTAKPQRRRKQKNRRFKSNPKARDTYGNGMTRIRARKAATSMRSKPRGRKRRDKKHATQHLTSTRKSPTTAVATTAKIACAEAENGSVVDVPTKSNRKVQREKGWIVSGDQPPITGTRRFVVPLKGTPSNKDAEREKHLLAQASRFEEQFREVKASRFAIAFGFRPGKKALGTGIKKKKSLKMKDIAKGKVGFTRTTANQRFREHELKVTREAKSKARKKFVSGAEDRVFFLHHH
jgi:hypothetical protein